MELVEHAHSAGRTFTDGLSRIDQKTLGQFMTPPAIATFMARRLVADVQAECVRVLEPAAGAGILAAAVIEELLAKADHPKRIELFLFECDERLLPTLDRLIERMIEACTEANIDLDWKVHNGDFLLSELALSGQPIEGLLTISNPPFFKLNKATDRRAALHPYAVHGQPNIYGLFMAACARLTPANGRWCFITPRSWMNGNYFQAVRHTVFRHLTVESLHAFESRKEGFEEDAVLQETVIAWASGRRAAEPGLSITLTTSQGLMDLDHAEMRALPMERVVGADKHSMVSLPATGQDPFAGWTVTLSALGLKVSTGPVVAFRASAHIREHAGVGTVPLLWLQHVGQQRISWPIRKKREHIRATPESAWMLVKNEPMVLMRRFSPKEDERRVTCSAYTGDLPGAVIGLENHLNYIYRPGGRMTVEEARGLSGFLASKLVDDQFRALAGSTQINATELRKLPLPSLEVIETIGRCLSDCPTLAEIDAVVEGALGLTPNQAKIAA